MKKNFDFLINKDEGFDKKILRFYTKQSKVHGFGNDAPKNWQDVYKTYMTFSVLQYDECWDNEGMYERPYELFSYYRDEGEGLTYLRDVLKEISLGKCEDKYEINSFGEGIDWEIYKDKRNSSIYIFNMIKKWSGKCYRFKLYKNQIIEFYNVLDNFLEYMLNHSVGT